MTKSQREYFVKTIKQKFDIDIEFYPKHPKGYGLLFQSEVDDELKEKIIKLYDAILKH